MVKPIKIAFLSEEDPRSPNSFSGVTFQLVTALERAGAEIFRLGPYNHPKVTKVERLLVFLYALRRRKYFPSWTKSSLRTMGATFAERLDGLEVDCIFSRNYSPVAFLEADVPVFIWNDAIFSLLENNYYLFTDLAHSCRNACICQEKRATLKATKAFYTSQWAADAAKNEYGASASNQCVVKVGANYSSNWDADTALRIISARDAIVCELLFIGSEWMRKGADRAIYISILLHQMGVKNRLTLVGPWPPSRVRLPEHVEAVGVLLHSDPTDRKRLSAIWANAHFLLLPSRGDCSPVSLADSMSFGVVPVASCVGGLVEMVTHGVTGYVSKMETEGDFRVVAGEIASLFSDKPKYDEMAIRCFGEHHNLTWDKHAKTLLAEIAGALEICSEWH